MCYSKAQQPRTLVPGPVNCGFNRLFAWLWSRDQLSVITETVHFWFVSTSWNSISKLGYLSIFSRISQTLRLQRPPKVRSICIRKTTFATQSCLHGFPSLWILKFLNLSLTHLRAQIACYELKGDLSLVMLKKIFHDSFKNFEITRICMGNHASVTGWQKLFFL